MKEENIQEIRLSAPGNGFADSFLLGNGAFGAALGMDPLREEVRLSHGCFFSGAPAGRHGRPGAPEAFRRARALSLAGRHAEAWEALKGFIGEKENYGTHLPLGSVIISQEADRVEDYSRTLSLSRGRACCAFNADGNRQSREARCLADPSVLEMVFRGEAPLCLTFALEGELIRDRRAEGSTLLFSAQALETLHSDGACGVRLEGGLRLYADGPVRALGTSLRAEGREIRLWLSLETDYDPDPALEERNRRETLPRRRVLEALARAEDMLFSPEGQKSPDLSHPGKPGFSEAADAGEDFLPPPRMQIEGQPRINRQVRLGEYLLRAAVREASPLPPALQGIWNDGEACRLGWTNDFHLDVNTQMNLWCADSLGEGDRLRPLFRFMRLRLIPEGRKCARGYYGLPGAVAELSTNAFGFAAPFWGRPLAPCPGCGFWLCEAVIRHAEACPEDEAFLREARDLLSPYVEFALAYLTETPEGLAGGPSVSPENGFTDRGRTVYASMGPAFENAQLRILLGGYVRICALLEARDPLAWRAEEALPRIPGPRIAPDGTLAEYAHDLPSADPHHRHLSHLTSLYPGREITPDTPALAAAAEKAIQSRLTPPEAFESTPWARVMLALYEARLGRGNEALAHLEAMLDQHLSPSLLLMHPALPGTENARPVWELDGNTGFVEAVKEMLVQNREDRLLLLPALPDAWRPGGQLRDLHAGPWRIRELSWKNGRICRLILSGSPGSRLTLVLDGASCSIRFPESGEWQLAESSRQSRPDP